MRALFTSYACDFCDGVAEVDYIRGYIVYRGDGDLFGGRHVYVFKTRTEAAIWRSKNDLKTCPIREVWTETPFRWRKTKGRVEGLTIAERPFEIYPDRRFEPARFRAFLAPRGSHAA